MLNLTERSPHVFQICGVNKSIPVLIDDREGLKDRIVRKQRSKKLLDIKVKHIEDGLKNTDNIAEVLNGIQHLHFKCNIIKCE